MTTSLKIRHERTGNTVTQDVDVSQNRDTILHTLGRLEAKIDMILDKLGQENNNKQDNTRSDLTRLTTKQHATLQMLLAGHRNREIAERFGVTENTAKVYVRAIAAKLGVTTRTQIVIRATPLLEAISDDDYRLMSGGLPKDWAENYAEPDRYAGLYRYEQQ